MFFYLSKLLFWSFLQFKWKNDLYCDIAPLTRFDFCMNIFLLLMLQKQIKGKNDKKTKLISIWKSTENEISFIEQKQIVCIVTNFFKGFQSYYLKNRSRNIKLKRTTRMWTIEPCVSVMVCLEVTDLGPVVQKLLNANPGFKSIKVLISLVWKCFSLLCFVEFEIT